MHFEPGHFQPGYAHPGAPWLVGLILLVLFVVLIGVIVWGVLRLGSAARHPGVVSSAPPRDPALEELRLRYARGELDRDQYLERARDLGDQALPAPPAPGTDGA